VVDDPLIADRQGAWDRDVTSQLPSLLRELLTSPIYGLTNGRPLPPEKYGIYLLITDHDEPMYVGRVGLTERSRLAGKKFASFRTRIKGHVAPRHNNGTYAYSRTCTLLREQGRTLGTRAQNCEDGDFMAEFRRQCELVRNMGVRVVEINDNKLAAVFEVYAATVLGLPQTFATS
jgi:hypothetical protein